MMNIQVKPSALTPASFVEHIAALQLSPAQQERLKTTIAGRELLEIFTGQCLTPVFQPIIDLARQAVVAHEALVRGPKQSFLHNPLNLLQTAEEHGCLFELDWLARLTSIQSFQHQQAKTLLFLNVSVNTIMQKSHRSGITLEYLHLLGIPVDQVVIEITELQPIDDFSAFVSSVDHYREMGFRVAVDDLGAGYNGLRIWSELRPDYVKIDHHFVSNLHNDPDKLHFMETLCNLAHQLDTHIIAEGVEDTGELLALEKLGINLVQGYLFQKPRQDISTRLDFDWSLLGGQEIRPARHSSIACLAQSPFVLTQDFNLMQVARFFFSNPDVSFSPVIINDRIMGIVWRDTLMTHIAHSLEFCTSPNSHVCAIMDREFITIAADTDISDAARILAAAQHDRRNTAFIITDKGVYAGCCTLASVFSHLLAQARAS